MPTFFKEPMVYLLALFLFVRAFFFMIGKVMFALNTRRIFKILSGFVFVAFVISFVFIFPRFLVKMSPEGVNNPWISYTYTYGLGTLFFLFSLFLILTKKIHPKRKRQVKLFILILTLMLLWGLFFHGFWTFMSLQYPFKGLSQ